MTTSENQVRHLYVHDAATSTVALKKKDNGDDAIYFEIKMTGDEENTLRSDIIAKKKVLWVNATKADKMQRKLKVATFTPGAVTAGFDYFVRVAYSQYGGQTEYDTYAKYGSAHAKAGASASDVLVDLAMSLAKSLAADACKTLEVKLDSTVVTATTAKTSLSGSYTTLVLTEVEQPWVIGTMESVPVNFTVGATSVDLANAEDVWGTVAVSEGTAIKNGKKTADLEYFLVGERGDQYRGIGFPNNVPTKLYVDPSKAYDYIDIHYFEDEANTNCEKSEKTLTIVGESGKLASIAAAIDGALDTDTATALT